MWCIRVDFRLFWNIQTYTEIFYYTVLSNIQNKYTCSKVRLYNKLCCSLWQNITRVGIYDVSFMMRKANGERDAKRRVSFPFAQNNDFVRVNPNSRWTWENSWSVSPKLRWLTEQIIQPNSSQYLFKKRSL